MIEQVRKNNSQSPRDDLRSEGLSAVGRELKEAREALGISVAEMANALRIRSVHIDSLEGGRFDELPGRPYTLGFARSMATHLGLDPDAVSMRLRDEVTGAAAPVELIFPESTEDKRLSRAGWIAISLALVAVAYGAWLALSPRRDVGPPEFASVNSNANTTPAPTPAATDSEPPSDADAMDDNVPDAAVVVAPPAPASVPAAPLPAPPSVVTKPPGVVAKPEPAPLATPPVAAVKPSVPAVAKPEPATANVAPAVPVNPPPAVASRPTPPPAAAGITPPPSASAATAPTPEAGAEDEEDTAPEPTTLAVAPTPATPAGHVTLRARQDSWVQIQSADGVTVMARTLHAGDSYTVPDRPGLRLTTGNAGALDVMVDGQIAPPIGQIGTVRRNVALDPARLKAGTALE